MIKEVSSILIASHLLELFHTQLSNITIPYNSCKCKTPPTILPIPPFCVFGHKNTRLTFASCVPKLSFQVVIQAPRKFAITRIMRYKVQMKATAPLLKLAQDDEAIGKWLQDRRLQGEMVLISCVSLCFLR